MALQRVLPPDDPIHLFHSDLVWSLPHDDLLDRYLRVSTSVCQALEAVVAHYSSIGVDAIIEGCWVLPEFASQPVFADRPNSAVLKPLFLYEPSSGELSDRLLKRDDGWHARQTPGAQANHVHMQWEFGNTIKRRAEALAMPVIESRPFDTLLERALAALELQHD
jgi:2-phosphoglycerate kinase